MDLFYKNEMRFVVGILNQNNKDRKMKEQKKLTYRDLIIITIIAHLKQIYISEMKITIKKEDNKNNNKIK